MADRKCPNCGRIWMTTFESPCDCPPERSCIDRDIFGHHNNAEQDVDEVVARSCPHGQEYDQLCKGCGQRVSGWGIGAAGFLELCGCVPDQDLT